MSYVEDVVQKIRISDIHRSAESHTVNLSAKGLEECVTIGN